MIFELSSCTLKSVFYDHLSFMARNCGTNGTFSLKMKPYFATTSHLQPNHYKEGVVVKRGIHCSEDPNIFEK